MANLTADQLKAIKDWYAGPMANSRPYQDASGNTFQQDEQGIYGYDPSKTAAGMNYARYAQDGSAMGQDKFLDTSKMELGEMLALGIIGGGAAGMFSGGAGGMFGVGGSGASTGGGLTGGPGSAGWGMDLGGAGMADTTYAANIGATGGLGGSSALPAAGGAAGLGGAGGAAGAAGAAGGASSLLGGASSMLGPLATAAGGLLGAQGNKAETSSERKMDPRLDGPVFGAQGIVPRAEGLLAQQMTPEGQAGWLKMQQQGQGLLSQPVAGNGFHMFYGRK